MTPMRRLSLQVTLVCGFLFTGVFLLSLIARHEGLGTLERGAFDAAVGFVTQQFEKEGISSVVFCEFKDAREVNTRENQWEVALWLEAPSPKGIIMRQDYVITVAYNEAHNSWSQLNIARAARGIITRG